MSYIYIYMCVRACVYPDMCWYCVRSIHCLKLDLSLKTHTWIAIHCNYLETYFCFLLSINSSAILVSTVDVDLKDPWLHGEINLLESHIHNRDCDKVACTFGWDRGPSLLVETYFGFSIKWNSIYEITLNIILEHQWITTASSGINFK